MPLSSAESTVFSKLSTTPYWSFAVASRLPNASRYTQQPFKPLGEPVTFLHVADNSSITLGYQWGKIPSVDEAKQLVTKTLSAVQSGAGLTPPVIKEEDIRAIRNWTYFPHFPTHALQSGDMYGAFNKLQGDQSTFFASGLNGFETIEFAIRSAQDLVKSFF